MTAEGHIILSTFNQQYAPCLLHPLSSNLPIFNLQLLPIRSSMKINSNNEKRIHYPVKKPNNSTFFAKLGAFALKKGQKSWNLPLNQLPIFNFRPKRSGGISHLRSFVPQSKNECGNRQPNPSI